jgi:hypothetical protein
MLCKLRVYYCTCYSPPLILILRQMNPAHVFPTDGLKIYSNIILTYTPRFSKRSFSFRFLHKKPCMYILLFSLKRATYFANLSIMKPSWCTFHSVYWESRASTCFEHYLLIIRRCSTNGTWYVACVLRQLAVPWLLWNCTGFMLAYSGEEWMMRLNFGFQNYVFDCVNICEIFKTVSFI